MTYLDPSTNYLYIVPEPYSPEDYQELENEIVGDDSSITYWTDLPEDVYTHVKISNKVVYPTFTIDTNWEDK